MSKTEYSFHTRKRKLQIDVPKPQELTPQESVKDIILGQYDNFTKLKQSDENVKRLCQSQEQISQEITTTFSILQQSENKSPSRDLHDKLNHLTALHKTIKAEYDELLKKEMSLLLERWPDIFEKVKEGIDRDTLEHVLATFELYQSGHTSADEAVMKGMDFMSKKYNLPRDFFNKSAVGQFNEKIKKTPLN